MSDGGQWRHRTGCESKCRGGWHALIRISAGSGAWVFPNCRRDSGRERNACGYKEKAPWRDWLANPQSARNKKGCWVSSSGSVGGVICSAVFRRDKTQNMLKMSPGFSIHWGMVNYGKRDVNRGRICLANKQNLENILTDGCMIY